MGALGLINRFRRTQRLGSAQVAIALYVLREDDEEPALVFSFAATGRQIERKAADHRVLLGRLLEERRAAPELEGLRMPDDDWRLAARVVINVLDQHGRRPARSVLEAITEGLCVIAWRAFDSYRDGDRVQIEVHESGEVRVELDSHDPAARGARFLGNANPASG